MAFIVRSLSGGCPLDSVLFSHFSDDAARPDVRGIAPVINAAG
jgi:hypothetical protein